jgi:hypothetical protein
MMAKVAILTAIEIIAYPVKAGFVAVRLKLPTFIELPSHPPRGEGYVELSLPDGTAHSYPPAPGALRCSKSTRPWVLGRSESRRRRCTEQVNNVL